MKLNNIFNDDNKTKLIGLFAILICVWLVLYFIPELFISLFNTILGNLILIIATILIYISNRLYGILFGLGVLILFRFSRLLKEGFNNNEVTNRDELEKHFLSIQNTINHQNIFDMDVIRSQATDEELAYFNKHGKWPWPQKVVELYEDAISRNPYIRTVPKQATDYARSIYNKNAILRLLSYQTKEGQFLLNGVLVKDPSGNKFEELPSGFGNFPYEVGLMEDRRDDVIKCNLHDENNPTLERIRYEGKGGIFGEQKTRVTPVDSIDLETLIPGFTFLGKPCNPCGALSATPDYSCAYRLRVKDKPPFVSNVWKYLWGLKDDPVESSRSKS